MSVPHDTQASDEVEMHGGGVPADATRAEQHSATAAQPLALGTDRYRPGELLGSGGMGEVRTHADTRIGREVAVKILAAKKSIRGRSAQRFVREAVLQARLDHPSVVPVYEVGTTPTGRPFFSMKRVKGRTLSEILKGRRAGDPSMAQKFTTRRLLEDFSRLCLAVDFIHQKGVIHRDIKPANVMIGEFGEVYLLDWGLAKQQSERALERGEETGSEEESVDSTLDGFPNVPTRDGAMLGTPGYMSPEQVRAADGIGRVTNKADVYSLGVMLYEIVTDRRLHRGRTVEERLASTLESGLISVRDRFPELNVSHEISSLIEEALNPLGSLRGCTPRDMHNRIQRHLDGFRDVESRHRQADELYGQFMATSGEGADASTARAIRAEALETLGRVLALRPDHPEALTAFVKLLARPPESTPPEVIAEIKQVEAGQVKTAGRLGALMFASLNIFGVWGMHISPPEATGAIVAFMVLTSLTAVISFSSTMVERPGPLHSLAVYLSALATSATLALLFGAFLVVPGIIAALTMAFAVNTPARWGQGFIALGVTFSVMLSAYGALSADAMGLLEPLLQQEQASGASVLRGFIALSSVAIVLFAGVAVIPIRRRFDLAQRRARTTSWQLQHLVPEQIRFLGDAGSSEVMRTLEVTLSRGTDSGVPAEGFAARSGVHRRESLTTHGIDRTPGR